MTRLPVRRLRPEAELPSHATPGDAGADLHAAEAVELAPGGGRALVPTGLALAVPDGMVGLVMPRSGLAVRHGVTVLNAPGVIDSGYRGELAVPLVNLDPDVAHRVEVGDRIAQLVLQHVADVEATWVEELPPSAGRGGGGFGSTGR